MMAGSRNPQIMKYHKTFAALTVSLAALCLQSVDAATYVLGASQTGMAYSFLPGWALGPMYPNMIAPANTGTSNHHMAAFLQYDLGSLISAGVTSSEITTATARLYLIDNAEAGFGASPSTANPVSVDFRLPGQAWVGSTLTWANQPGGSYNAATTVPPGEVVGTISGITGSGMWVELDITNILKGWLDNPATNFGFRLTETSEVRDVSGNAIFPAIASQTNTDSSIRPQMVVTTVPETSSVLLIAISTVGMAGFRRRAA